MQNGNRTEHPHYASENWNPAGNDYNVGMTPSEHGDAPDHFEQYRAWSREQMARYIEQKKHDPDISMELPPGDDNELVVIESLASLSPEEQVAEFNRREEIKRRKQLVDERWRRVSDDARAEFASQLDNQHDLIAEQTEKIEKYERKIARLEEELAEARRRANRTEEQIREEYERQPAGVCGAPEGSTRRRRSTERPGYAGPSASHNRVIFDVKATISPDAEETLEAIKKRHGPTKKLRVTQELIEGQSLWIKMEYTVRGGHPADIRRALSKCVADAGAEMVGEPIIDVIEREKLPEPDSPGAT